MARYFCWFLLIGALHYLTAAADTSDSTVWRRAHEVAYVEMTAAQVSKSYMRQLRRKYGHENFPPAQAWRGAGMALLWKREDGVYACNIYVLDIGDERVLEHEVKHCHGWVHD